jgi:hypothetical protein
MSPQAPLEMFDMMSVAVLLLNHQQTDLLATILPTSPLQ